MQDVPTHRIPLTAEEIERRAKALTRSRLAAEANGSVSSARAPTQEDELQTQIELWQAELARAAHDGHGIDSLNKILLAIKMQYADHEDHLSRTVTELRDCADRHLEEYKDATVEAIFQAVFPAANQSPEAVANDKQIAKQGEEVGLEPPRPLTRELPPADPFPIDNLGDFLGKAARAIHDRVQAPIAICGQSVLAAATLAVQAHANVELPMGQTKPLSNYFLSVAASGERKTAVDEEALRPIRQREAELRESFASEILTYQNDQLAWEKAREKRVKDAKGDRAKIKAALDELGPAPPRPLEPILTCGEPTYEGLCKLLLVGQPSVGIFAAEGGQFIGGHGMGEDAKLRTAAGLSLLWDGQTIDRIRAQEATLLVGRRVTMHLMGQPDVVTIWLSDHLLLDQGLLSRTLLTRPEPASGRRLWRTPLVQSHAILKRYNQHLLEILRRPLPLAAPSQNELAPRALPLSPKARDVWIGFYDHVEKRLGAGGELEPVQSLANKLPEHAARIAAVLTLCEDLKAPEVNEAAMARGISLAQHYAAEALRLFGSGQISADLRDALGLLQWSRTTWTAPLVSLPDIYQRGPNAIRDATKARRIVEILEEHGHWVRVPGGGEIGGVKRREVWRIVNG
jgi:hypothetical protein